MPNPRSVDATGKLPVDYVPEQEIHTKKLLTIGKFHPQLAKNFASTLSSKRESPTEAHFKELNKLESLVLKQFRDVSKLEEEIANLNAASATLEPKKYQKTLQRLQKKRNQMDAELENCAGTFALRKNQKRKLSWLAIFSFSGSNEMK